MRQARHNYDVAIHWVGRSPDDPWNYASYSRSYTMRVPGKIVLYGSADPTFRGDAERHNPEDLFVAAISACHMLTYLALCARQGIEVVSYVDNASGDLTLAPGAGGRFSSVVLRPTVGLASRADWAVAEALHTTAHEQCFIAASCRVVIECHPRIVPPPIPEIADERSDHRS